MFDLNAYTGFEDNSEETVILEGPAAELAVKDADNVISEAQEEVAEIQADVTELEARLDVLEDTAEVVEEKLDGMEAMLKGTKPFNSELLQATFADVNRMLQRVDSSHMGRVEKNGLVGNEAFGDQSTADVALHDGMEAIGETLAKVGNAIKTFFVNLYKSFVAMIIGLFSAIKGVKAKADALSTKLNGFAEDKIKDEIKLSKATSFVKFDGKLSNNLNIMTPRVVSGVTTAMSANNSDGIIKAVSGAGTAIVSEGDKKESKGSNDNTETLEIQIGQAKVRLVAPKSGAKDEVAALNAASISIMEGAAAKEGTQKSSMSKSDLQGICKKVSAAAQQVISASKDESELNKIRDQAITALGDGKDDETKKKASVIKAGHKAGLKMIAGVVKIDAKVLNSNLAVVSAHL